MVSSYACAVKYHQQESEHSSGRKQLMMMLGQKCGEASAGCGIKEHVLLQKFFSA